MADFGKIVDNMSKGKGVTIDKDNFRVVGFDASDRKHPLLEGESRGRGRPSKDKDFTQVGPHADQEQGSLNNKSDDVSPPKVSPPEDGGDT
ncbi:MAG: hypothetical protein CMB80_00800 [Flammeovirgaceae bacterium]|nr:hypothetical protein [Flammeovirgaceae bacterium]